jgi:thioredoxin 1
MVIELDQESFQKEVIDTEGIIIVDFWASWCGPCKALAPVFEELSQDSDLKDKLRFAKVSTESHSDIATSNQVSGIPCLIIYKNGKEVNRIVGFSPKGALKQKIKEAIGE